MLEERRKKGGGNILSDGICAPNKHYIQKVLLFWKWLYTYLPAGKYELNSFFCFVCMHCTTSASPINLSLPVPHKILHLLFTLPTTGETAV